MKKFMYILLAVALAMPFSGCTQTKDTPSSSAAASTQQGHAVVLDQVGLYYVTPVEWLEYEETNIYPQTIKSEGAIARVIYNYINAEDVAKINESASEESINDYLTPICEITVGKTADFNSGVLSYVSDEYKNNQEACTQDEYSYYFYDTAKDYGNLQGDDKEIYEKLTSPEVMKSMYSSIFSKPFNPEDIKTTAETLGVNDYITFETTTLEGEEISSACFGDYDVTLFNFWGTYAIERSNEQADLQAVYEATQQMDKKVNVINAIVDTPDATAEEMVKQLKAEAGGQFTTIIMDETLATWSTNNLEGVPTTVLVDSTGKIVSDQIKGAKGSEFYIDVINEYLDAQ